MVIVREFGGGLSDLKEGLCRVSTESHQDSWTPSIDRGRKVD
jgi:hypothetical protein